MKETEKELLKLDYEKTLAFIDKADGILFQIRKWAIVSCSGVISYAVSNEKVKVLIANVILVFAFGLYELIYKSFHEDCIRKSYELEELLKKSIDSDFDLPSEYVFGIGHAINAVNPIGLLKILVNPKKWHITFLYIVLLGMTGIVLLYLK